jgi:DNA-damage-inducible protein D
MAKCAKRTLQILKYCFRIIQSIPSPKAEPFKQWLAKVGYERMSEIANPEESIERIIHQEWSEMV